MSLRSNKTRADAVMFKVDIRSPQHETVTNKQPTNAELMDRVENIETKFIGMLNNLDKLASVMTPEEIIHGYRLNVFSRFSSNSTETYNTFMQALSDKNGRKNLMTYDVGTINNYIKQGNDNTSSDAFDPDTQAKPFFIKVFDDLIVCENALSFNPTVAYENASLVHITFTNGRKFQGELHIYFETGWTPNVVSYFISEERIIFHLGQ